MEATKKCQVLASGRIGTKTSGELINAGAYITISNLSSLPSLLQQPWVQNRIAFN